MKLVADPQGLWLGVFVYVSLSIGGQAFNPGECVVMVTELYILKIRVLALSLLKKIERAKFQFRKINCEHASIHIANVSKHLM